MSSNCLNIETTLGSNARVIDSGGKMFRIVIDTEEKHPFAKDLWTTYCPKSDELVCYKRSLDDRPVFKVTGLPRLDEDNWWQAIVLPGTRWALEIIVYPVFVD